MDRIRKLKFFCQKILPLVFDDSLSYYEVLGKFNHKLGEVIDEVNRQGEEIEEIVQEKIEVYQTTGDSNTGVMSQKATTDALDDKPSRDEVTDALAGKADVNIVPNVVQTTGQGTFSVMSQKATTDALAGKADSEDVPQVLQTEGQSTSAVMSQKATTDALAGKSAIATIFEDVVANNWVSDATYTDYPYKADLTCQGVTADDIANVMFDGDEAVSGNYAPFCETSTNTVTIYGKSNTSITIPIIRVGGAADAQIINALNVTVDNITGGHRISISNGTDTDTFDVMNGTNGTDGSDGVSPAVEIESITGGHQVTITDMEYPEGQSFDVMDGEDGVSPEVAITDISGGHRVTITDAEHPIGQSFNVMDGVSPYQASALVETFYYGGEISAKAVSLYDYQHPGGQTFVVDYHSFYEHTVEGNTDNNISIKIVAISRVPVNSLSAYLTFLAINISYLEIDGYECLCYSITQTSSSSDERIRINYIDITGQIHTVYLSVNNVTSFTSKLV